MFRQDFLRLIAGLASASRLRSQGATPSAVVLKVAVTDGQGRYIHGLTAGDFRVWEDGIPQKISAFAGAIKPRTLSGPKPDSGQDTFESIRHDLDNSYTITYHPDPSNRNEAFRKIKIEIVPDVDRKWRVRHRPGYRAES